MGDSSDITGEVAIVTGGGAGNRERRSARPGRGGCEDSDWRHSARGQDGVGDQGMGGGSGEHGYGHKPASGGGSASGSGRSRSTAGWTSW